MEEDRLITYGYARDNFQSFKKYDAPVDFLEPNRCMTKEALTTFYSFDPFISAKYSKNSLLPRRAIRSYDLPIALSSPLSVHLHGTNSYNSSIVSGLTEERGTSVFGVQENSGNTFYRAICSDVSFFVQNNVTIATGYFQSGYFGQPLHDIICKICNVNRDFFSLSFRVKSLRLEGDDKDQPFSNFDKILIDQYSLEAIDLSYYQSYRYFLFDMFCQHDTTVPSPPRNTNNKVFYNHIDVGLNNSIGRKDFLSFGHREVMKEFTRSKDGTAYQNVLYSYKPFTIEMEFKAVGKGLEISLGTVFFKMFQQKPN